MCNICTLNEQKMLGGALQDFLRPGVKIAVKYANNDSDTEEVILVDEENKIELVLSTVGYMCWEAKDYGNVEKITDHEPAVEPEPVQDAETNNVFQFRR